MAISENRKIYQRCNESFVLSVDEWVQFKLVLKQVTSIFTMWSADCRAFGPAARSPVALREVPGCSGVAAQLVD